MKLQNAIDLERFLKSALAREVAGESPVTGRAEVSTDGLGREAPRGPGSAGIEPHSPDSQPIRPATIPPMKTETLEATETIEPELTAEPSSAQEARLHGIRLNELLVPMDFTEMSLKALQYAVSFARQYGARLTLLHIIEPVTIATELSSAMLPTPEKFASMKRELGIMREKHIPPEVATDMVVRYDSAAEGILNAAWEFKSDLIIIATHGRTGLRHLLMGSTAEKVVRMATCPVLVVRETERDFV